MKKYLVSLTAILVLSAMASSCAFAKANSASSPVKIAIKKYKMRNYTGCLQDCQAIVQRDPSNALAYYYMGMSYAQAGMKDAAVNSYTRVLALNPNPRLLEYATTGKRCLETPDKCHPSDANQQDQSALDKFIASPTVDGLSSTVRKGVQQRSLDAIKNEINSDKEIDSYDLKKLNQNEDQAFKSDKIANDAPQDIPQNAPNTPTNDEIVAALKVLKKAGLADYSQMPANNPYAQAENYQNQEQAQLNMLMGTDGKSQNNDVMMNMLPFMLAQNKNGSANNYSPQMMQAVIMNSMMSNMNFDMDKDKDR